MNKPTFRIEPITGRRFAVVRFDRAWWRNRRTIVTECARLQEAEMELCRVLDWEYMKELDRKYYDPSEYNVAALYPRKDEEQIYVALVLAGCPPPNENEVYYHEKKDAIIEQMLGRQLNLVERRLFEGRFMSWYAEQTPHYKDPRRNIGWGEPTFVDPYRRPSPLTGTAVKQSAMAAAYRALVNKILGRTP